MEYEKVARDILNKIGGKDNVNMSWHCATRLRFKLKDDTIADTQSIEEMDDVITVVNSAGQYQVVIGNDVSRVYDPLQGMLGDVKENNKTEVKKENIFNQFIEFISSVFTPFLGALAGTGVLKGLLELLVVTGALEKSSGTYQIWYAAGDAFFYFLPIWLAFTAASRLKINKFVSASLAATLLYPNLMGSLSGDNSLYFMGIKVIPTNYVSSVIPILISVWILSYIEPNLDRIFPKSIRNIFTPMFSLLIMVPLTLVCIGPLGTVFGSSISSAISSIYNQFPYIAGAIMGGLWQVFVIFGVHWTFVPIMTNNLAQLGYDYLLPILTASVLAQAGAALGVFLKTSDNKMKSLSGSSIITSVLGITEPTIYGVTLKLKKPFIFAIIAGAIGGFIIGLGGTHATAFAPPSLLAFPVFLGKGFNSLIIGVSVAFIISAIMTYFFGVDENNESHDNKKEYNFNDKEYTEILAPVSGKLMPIELVNDPVFSSESMGKSVAIYPTENIVKSPVNGVVVATYPTKHAIGILSDEGIEILIHVGIDTVNLQGKFFNQMVKDKEIVSIGSNLIEFDRESIENEGYDIVVMTIITNSSEYEVLDKSENLTDNNYILKVKK